MGGVALTGRTRQPQEGAAGLRARAAPPHGSTPRRSRAVPGPGSRLRFTVRLMGMAFLLVH